MVTKVNQVVRIINWASTTSPGRTSELNANFVYVCLYVTNQSTGQCAWVFAQHANIARLAPSAHCACPQMLCILLIIIPADYQLRLHPCMQIPPLNLIHLYIYVTSTLSATHC